MAEKFLNTRIKLRIDTLENWNKSTVTLLPGEVAFATVAASAGTGLTEPVVMAKIATEEGKTFSELPWAFHAKSSDILTACKTEAGLTAFVNNVIANAGIATSTAMEALAGRVTTVENDLNTAETGLKARMTTAEGAIDALEALVGDKKVADQITAAITALNLANTYEAKGEAAKVQTALETYKTSNDAAVLANTNAITANTNAITAIKDGTTLDSFADVESALAGKEAAGAAAQALTDAKAYADGLAGNYDAKGAAATAESNAKTYAKEYADSLAVNYDAAGSADDALEEAKGYTDSEMTRLVGDRTVGTQISEAITGLDLDNTYAAKVHTHVKADITDFAHTHIKSEITDFAHTHVASEITDLDATIKGYDYATKTEAKGYADAKDEAIAAALKAGTDAQGEVDALETYVGTIPETAEATNIVAYIQEKTAGIATDTALEELTGRVADAEGEIDTLQGLVGDTKVSDAIATAVATEKARAEGVESGLESRLATVEGDYLKAADKKDLQDQIDANESAIELLTNGVSADEVDGVNDLIQYVKDHGTEVTGMKKDISDNADAIAAEKERAEGIEGGLDSRLQAVEAAVGETGSVATAIEGAVTEAKGYTDAEVKKLAEGAVATNAADIAALETKVGDETVSEQITAVTDPLAERVVALEAIDHEHANKDLLDTYTQTEANLADAVAKKHEHANKAELDKIADGDKAAWDAKVDSVTAAADSGLKATRTGNAVAIEIDESVTFIFDCGTSAE